MKVTSNSFRWISDASGTWLCVKCSHPERIAGALESGKLYDVDIKQHRERRSLDANGYFWTLADKLAEKLSTSGSVISKEEIYQNLLMDIPGTSDTVCVVSDAVDKVRESWRRNGLGWITEVLPSKIPGCTNVVLHYGSSAFDTKQMSMLIDRIVEECKAQGIETMTPEELSRLEGM